MISFLENTTSFQMRDQNYDFTAKKVRGIEWTEEDSPRKISAQLPNLGILNTRVSECWARSTLNDLEVSNFYNLKSCYRPAQLLLRANEYSLISNNKRVTYEAHMVTDL